MSYRNMWGVTDFDAQTGLPAVPEGYFWRVKAPSRLGEYYTVQLRKRWRLVGSRTIGWTVISRGKISAAEVVDSACYALTYSNEILSHFGNLVPVRKDLVGNYPPKRIVDGDTNE
jgi:hypothetical protein